MLKSDGGIQCSSPWILCRHKDSPAPLANMTDHFGRVPVRARQWVRHVVSLPDRKFHSSFSTLKIPTDNNIAANSESWAYNSNANIVMFDTIDGIVPRFIHETAHSLDLQGAYQRQDHVTESSAQNWIDNYNQDPNVPDAYSQTNMIEDVAQASVIAAFDINVPGGYGGIEPKAANIFHQYATIITMQREAGNLLVPGGSCTRRLANSQPVQAGAMKRMSRVMRARDEGMPDVSLADELDVIPPKEFSTKEACSRQH